MSFPTNPVNGQQIILGNVTYQYNTSKTAWIRAPGLISSNIFVLSLTATGNVSAGAYYWANGTPFASSTYANSNVTAYLPTDTFITGINSNVFVLQGNITSLESNAAIQENEISSLRANITAANAAIISDASNISILQGNITSLESNAAIQENEISGLRANITAANVVVISSTSNISILQGNITSLESNAAIQENEISGLRANITAANAAIAAANFGNSQVAAYIIYNTLHPFMLMGS